MRFFNFENANIWFETILAHCWPYHPKVCALTQDLISSGSQFTYPGTRFVKGNNEFDLTFYPVERST